MARVLWAIANLLQAAAEGYICWTIIRPSIKRHRIDALCASIFFLFLIATVRHIVVIVENPGISSPLEIFLSILGGTAALAYIGFRHKYKYAVDVYAAYADIRAKEEHLLLINDTITQVLVSAKLKSDLGRDNAAEVEEALSASRKIITEVASNARIWS